MRSLLRRDADRHLIEPGLPTGILWEQTGQALVEAASSVVGQPGPLHAFYERLRARRGHGKAVVANIDNTVATHIHCGAVGLNGPVGVTLFMGPPATGRLNGTLAEGTITAPDPGNGCGWTDLAAVLAAINSGDTVNVHTNDGVALLNTGPGDIPGGEIHGQIR